MPRLALRMLGASALVLLSACGARAQAPSVATADTIRLPAPQAKGPLSLEEALVTRRSVRQWAPGSLKLAELAQLVWAAQGVTSPDGKRTAPSAMARYPIEVYVVAAAVDGLAPGAYRYVPKGHALVHLVAADSVKDRRAAVAGAARGQASVATAPVVFVVAAVPARFGNRADALTDRFIAIEAGAVLQNLYLQATALHLGAVAVGGYQEQPLIQAVPLAAGERPMIVVPVGRRP